MPQRISRKINTNGFILLAGTANLKLARNVAKILKKNLDEPISIFSDGEIRVRIGPNMRRRHVFIIQPTSKPVNDNFMQLILMIDAAKRASATEVTAVVPYFGYSRQDRKEMARVPISASVVANMIRNAGADRIFTIDLHSEQQSGFIKAPWDNVYASYSLIPAIKSKKLKDIVVASPDKGGMTRATGYAKLLKAANGVALVYKERDIAVNNKSEALAMIGDVKGKDVLLVDDIIDTAGTIVSAANYLKKCGARSVRAAATHGIFSEPAIKRIEQSAMDEVIVTDTVAIPQHIQKNKRITVVSVAPLVAAAIERIDSGESISKDLIMGSPSSTNN